MKYIKTDNPRELDALICEHVLGWEWFSRLNHSESGQQSCRWLLRPSEPEVNRLIETGGLFPAAGSEPIADDYLSQTLCMIPFFHARIDYGMLAYEQIRRGREATLQLSMQISQGFEGSTWVVLESPIPLEEWADSSKPEYDRWYGYHAQSASIALCLALLSFGGIEVEIGEEPRTEAPRTCLEQTEAMQNKENQISELKAALLAVSRFWYAYRSLKEEMWRHPEALIQTSTLHGFLGKMPCGESLAFQSMIKSCLGLKYLDELNPDCRHYQVKIRVVSVSPGAAQISIPDWKDETVHVELKNLPDMVRMAIQQGATKLVGRINPRAEKPEELHLCEVKLDVE